MTCTSSRGAPSPFLLPLLIAATAALAACGGDDGSAPAVDLVLLNGDVYTVDAARSRASAVAIDDGDIVYVGDDTSARELAGPGTRIVDLGGRLLLPGFQDAHIHPIGGGVEASACDLNNLSGVEAYRSAVLDYANANPDVEWITGGGWLMSHFGAGGAPDKSILDELVPDRPVYLSSSDGHSAWVNSRALELAGIDRNTPDPADGRIDRDPATGEPSGGLQEGAMDLVGHLVPPTTAAERERGLRYAIEMLNRYGITSMQDAHADEEALETYRAVERAGDLTMRVVGAIWWERNRGLEQVEDIVALRERFGGSDLVRPTAVKIMQDGVMENYTAALLEPYLIEGGGRGIPMVDPELLMDAVTALDARGFQVHFHAIGDAAIRQSLDAIEAAALENGRQDHRHHVSHLQLIDPADIPRFAELGVVANFQPVWAYPDEYITELTAPFLGPARMRWMYPIRSVLDAGGRVAFGSDWSVSTANPFPQIEVAVRRADAVSDDDTDVLVPEEAIGIEDAIAAFTINAAFVNHQDLETGSIETGKYADLVVLDQNILEIDAKRISDTRVLVTLLAGRPVYGSFDDLD